jgi:hypothetical protein
MNIEQQLIDLGTVNIIGIIIITTMNFIIFNILIESQRLLKSKEKK